MVLLAKIIGPKGVRGNIKIDVFTEDPLFLVRCPLVYNEKKEKLQFDFVGWVSRPSKIEARCHGISSREQTQALKGIKLYTSIEHLKALPDDHYYWKELEGYKVQFQENLLGTVLRMNNFGATDLLEISLSKDASSVYLPFHKTFITNVCKAQHIIFCTNEAEEWIQNTN
ncbi:ribosome maturation factor RimM [Holospora elegans E1]|uniref:Ribosome maturation factor RimM n=1 Tax=Holospora elegans E1 TaxID=1427503 RepID=A0A023DXV7_9PROT|nr:ribosome maturation factor RimM [Holospora elegans]GAJ46276.1 ribosome maturation factor RimM [Holospora elegans E1]